MKKMLISVLVVMVCIFPLVSINASHRAEEPSGSGDTITQLITGTDKIWTSVLLIVQIVSVGCVVMAGVRYMFASADQKADIKKGLIYLVIGASLIFATSTIIRFVMNVGNEIIK